MKKLIAGAIITLSFAVFVAGNASPASALTAGEIQTQIQEVFSRLTALQPWAGQSAVVSASPSMQPSQPRICGMLSRPLSFGYRGDDVAGLQEFLNTEGYFSVQPTGYFGPFTTQALMRWQASQGIGAVGIMGPMTRAHIAARCGGISQSGRFDASPTSGPAPLAVNFTYTPPTDDAGQYYITFGDGSGEIMNKQQIYCIRAPCISPSIASHTYMSAGTYTAVVERYFACLFANPRCLPATMPLGQVQIVVFGGTIGNRPPTISSFAGPTVLSVGATGMWTIAASDPENQPLSYDISWGDERFYPPYMGAQLSSDAFVQTTTFTHSYAASGTYTVRATVRDGAGMQASATMTVQVGGGGTVCTAQYDPVCGRPPGCMNTCPPGMYCTMMCQLHPPQTYSNRCAMDAAGASFLYSGPCN